MMHLSPMAKEERATQLLREHLNDVQWEDYCRYRAFDVIIRRKPVSRRPTSWVGMFMNAWLSMMMVPPAMRGFDREEVRVYRIYTDINSYNVVRKSPAGHYLVRYCVTPKEGINEWPRPDRVVFQKMLLESDEDGFLRLAHRLNLPGYNLPPMTSALLR